jgi:ketosteroid isomerase-like protein
VSHGDVGGTQRIFEAFNARDQDGLFALLADDVVVESRLSALEGAYEGHDGARRWWDDLLGTFGDYRLEVEDIRAAPGGTIARLSAAATAAGSSTPLFEPYWIAMHWRDGKVAWCRVLPTDQEALAALAARS